MIWLPCPSCLMSFSVGDQEAGKNIMCPVCQTPVRVPGNPVSPPVAAKEPPPEQVREIDIPIATPVPVVSSAALSPDIPVAVPAPGIPVAFPVTVARVSGSAALTPLDEQWDEDERPKKKQRRLRERRDDDDPSNRDILPIEQDEADRPRRKKSRSKKKQPAAHGIPDADDRRDYSPLAGFFTRNRMIGIIFMVWGLAAVIFGLSTPTTDTPYGIGRLIGGVFGGGLILVAGIVYTFRGE